MDADALKELFAPFGAVVVRRMFSGKGVYADEMMFAMEMDGEVYLKADAETETLFVEAGSTPFIYQGHARPVKVNFWRLAANACDDADELRRWCAVGMAATRRAARAKAGKGKPHTVRRAVAKAKTARKS